MGNNKWLWVLLNIKMHPTTDVSRKDKPPFDQISDNMYQSNVMKQLFHREVAQKEELLPSTLYNKKGLEETLEELKERGLIEVIEDQDNSFFELSEKTVNTSP